MIDAAARGWYKTPPRSLGGIVSIAARSVGVFIISGLLLSAAPSVAQESKSAALAAELCKLLDDNKLDSIAAKQSDDQYVGALYFPGTQLLVVKGKFGSKARMAHLLENKEFREVYMDLSGASEQQTRVFVMDLGANGLRFRREGNQPFDTADVGPKSFRFDGEWSKAKISENDYRKTFTDTDEEYAGMLQALIGALKKPS
jgi:hypothetical protein